MTRAMPGLLAALVLLGPGAAPAEAAPYTQDSCNAESWGGVIGSWVYVRGWGWGCVHPIGPAPTGGSAPMGIIGANGVTYSFAGGKVGAPVPSGGIAKK